MIEKSCEDCLYRFFNTSHPDPDHWSIECIETKTNNVIIIDINRPKWGKTMDCPIWEEDIDEDDLVN